jgi:DNA invertase Pin-like site-specific DNA recombinase
MAKRAAIYVRVSTEDQTTDNQLIELQAIAARAGWDVVKIYQDAGVSGSKASRPGLDDMKKDATRRQFDVLMCWSIDRLGRSVHSVSGLMAELETLGVAQYYHQQNIDSSTPSGKAMVQMCLVFAEFEAGMISERVKAGMARARSQGKHVGRPWTSRHKIDAIKSALASGKGKRKIASEMGVGVGTVLRVARAG